MQRPWWIGVEQMALLANRPTTTLVMSCFPILPLEEMSSTTQLGVGQNIKVKGQC